MTRPLARHTGSGDNPRPDAPFTLITGGAGFIGCNLAAHLLAQGRRVLILDNLSRPGVERNAEWLRDNFGDRVELAVADIRDSAAVLDAVARADHVFHFAAQVAVTTSVTAPVDDFLVNAQGTLNVLEAVRAQAVPPTLVFTSTNKVYGALDDVALTRTARRYHPTSPATRNYGISEARALSFHSPYGCSKGTADQYVLDYARSYGIPTVVFRMSCIYGPHQFGTEDQGWVAHFLLRALDGTCITLYGDGMQVRDILYVDDLVEAFLLAEKNIARIAGQAFNIGGGPANAISLLDLIEHIERLHGDRPELLMQGWRTGDQRYYVSDTRSFQHATGWVPKVRAEDGIERLYRWLLATRAPNVARQRSTARTLPPASRAEAAR